MEKTKDTCDVCEKEKESTFSDNLGKYMCRGCWNAYGELCNYGLA